MEAAWARVVVPPGSSLPSLPLMSPLPLAQLMAVVAHELTALLSGNWERSPWAGQVASSRQIITLVLGVVVQHLGELLPADRVVGGELPVSLAGHHAVFVGPANGVPPPVDKGHVVKVGEPAEAGLPL